jgi:TonB family protein
MTSHHDRDEQQFTTSLIRRAARRAPPELAERLEEEWLADLTSRRAGLSRLRFALGCLWASRVIAHDFLAAGVATSPATVHRNALVLGPLIPSPFSHRSIIFMLVVGIHAVLIYAFASGFAGRVIRRVIENPTATIIPLVPHQRQIDSIAPHDAAISREHPPIPRLDPAKVDFGPAILTPPTVIDTVDTGPAPTGPTPAVKRMAGGPGVGFPDTDDYYPPATIRDHEQGVTTVGVCVNEHGRLSADPTLVQSSGFQRLDDGALKLAKAGSGHYRSTTEDGRPVSDCYSFRVRFKLKQ